MHPFPHGIRQPTHGKNVAGAVENHSVGVTQPLIGENFPFNRMQTRIVGLKWVRNHHLYDNPPCMLRIRA